jgi:hypothetical protein
MSLFVYQCHHNISMGIELTLRIKTVYQFMHEQMRRRSGPFNH